MHCPRCGQQQVSEEIKFCSRCGFPLGLISEILAHGGFLPQLAELYKSRKVFTRRNGLIFTLFWFLFIVAFVIPFLAITNAPGGLAAVVALFGTMSSLLLLLVSLLILKKPPEKFELPNKNNRNIYANQSAALPPTQNQPAQSYAPPADSWKVPNTGEFARPGSVTEGTTKLLQKDQE